MRRCGLMNQIMAAVGATAAPRRAPSDARLPVSLAN